MLHIRGWDIKLYYVSQKLWIIYHTMIFSLTQKDYLKFNNRVLDVFIPYFTVLISTCVEINVFLNKLATLTFLFYHRMSVKWNHISWLQVILFSFLYLCFIGMNDSPIQWKATFLLQIRQYIIYIYSLCS